MGKKDLAENSKNPGNKNFISAELNYWMQNDGKIFQEEILY